MKKQVGLLFPLLFTSFLTSCGGSGREKIQLTFGNMETEKTIHISSASFDTMVKNKENFLLAIYPKDTMCSCWSTFERVLDQATVQNHLAIYNFYAEDVYNNATMKRIGGFYAYENQPSFYIVGNGELIKAYEYDANNSFYKKYNSFMDEINERCYLPRLMKVGESQLNTLRTGDAIIYFARNSCEDCSYATPNAVTPYIEKHQGNDYIYYFDFDPYRVDMDDYQQKKHEYLLSTKYNPTLGFGDGVFPTFQVYKNGSLVDMDVYVNDGLLTYNPDDNGYYATNSYYSGERLNYFHYLNNVENKDFSKIKFTYDDVEDHDGIYILKRDAAAKYHNVYLNAFLDYYLK